MQLIIDVSKNNPCLILKRKNKIIARHCWPGHLDLSEKLILEIDKFLKQHHLKLQDLETITSRSNKKSIMSSSIASVTAQIVQWAKS